MTGFLDLLGDPIPEGWGERGRPEHLPTERNRNKITMLLAFGWTKKRIANAVSVSVPTLNKHYFRELAVRDQARDRLEAGLAAKLLELAEDGNVAAAKEFRRLWERNDMMVADLDARAAARKGKKAPKLGKKEQALQEARQPDVATPLGELMARRSGSDAVN